MLLLKVSNIPRVAFERCSWKTGFVSSAKLSRTLLKAICIPAVRPKNRKDFSHHAFNKQCVLTQTSFLRIYHPPSLNFAAFSTQSCERILAHSYKHQQTSRPVVPF